MTTLSPHRRSTPAPPRTSPVHAYTVAALRKAVASWPS
ncbi:hypothetical protein QFZ66_006520 [Streptomyces sp. B4I13]|nr:hypothetical protein [Streptomyces sp. B4I13]